MSLVKMLVSLSENGLREELKQRSVSIGCEKENCILYSPLFSFALTGVGEDVGEGVGS